MLCVTYALSEFRSLLPDLTLSSANSMNWGRFLPQIVFSISSYLRLVSSGAIRLGDSSHLVVPTGNFGNILGAVYAKLVLGLPIGRIVCASNTNNILYDFLRTGTYDLRQRRFTQTVSPSIDILVSSNLERFLHLLTDGDAHTVDALFTQLQRDGHFTVSPSLLARMQSVVEGGWATEEECLGTIKATFDTTGELIGHTRGTRHEERGGTHTSSRAHDRITPRGQFVSLCAFSGLPSPAAGLLSLSDCSLRSAHRRRRSRREFSPRLRRRDARHRVEHGALRQVPARHVPRTRTRGDERRRGISPAHARTPAVDRAGGIRPIDARLTRAAGGEAGSARAPLRSRPRRRRRPHQGVLPIVRGETREQVKEQRAATRTTRHDARQQQQRQRDDTTADPHAGQRHDTDRAARLQLTWQTTTMTAFINARQP